MRIVFAGTPAFALPALTALVSSAAWRPVAVLAQPDRGAGRGRKLRFGPVKQAAVEAGIEVLQPHTLKDAEARAALADLRPDLIVDRKSTRLNSSHVAISYAVFCLKKK